MRRRNSTIMIGRVKLKSKRAAFSIAREGGAKAKESDVAARVIDLSFEIWSLSLGLMVGSEIWSMGSLGVGGEREIVGTRIMGLEDAMIIVAIARVIWRISYARSVCCVYLGLVSSV